MPNAMGDGTAPTDPLAVHADKLSPAPGEWDSLSTRPPPDEGDVYGPRGRRGSVFRASRLIRAAGTPVA